MKRCRGNLFQGCSGIFLSVGASGNILHEKKLPLLSNLLYWDCHSKALSKWCSCGVVSIISSRKTIGISGFFRAFRDTAVTHKKQLFHSILPGAAQRVCAVLWRYSTTLPAPKKAGAFCACQVIASGRPPSTGWRPARLRRHTPGRGFCGTPSASLTPGGGSPLPPGWPP